MIPANEDGLSREDSLLAFNTGAQNGFAKDMGLNDPSSSRVNIGEDSIPAICWGGMAVADSEPVHLYACGDIKHRHDGSSLANMAFTPVRPSVWAQSEAEMQQSIQFLTAAFFLGHELEE